jgi:mRNA interferase MazF
VVICAAPGDYGKPRPAVVVQSDSFNATHPSVVICPISSEQIETPLFRVPLRPSAANGLRKDCQVMVDKMMALRRDRIAKRAGKLSRAEMDRVDSILRMWLDIA